MNLHKIIFLGLVTLCFNFPTLADSNLIVSDNDESNLKVYGAIRANYQEKDYLKYTEDGKIKFDAGILGIGYDSRDWFGKIEYRCYQFDTLCDFSTLVFGYAGYNLNATDSISIGLQPIPFGPSRFWDSSFYASINNTMGLQDAHNLGVIYHFKTSTETEVDLSYYFSNGGSYKGIAGDASRYTANLISSNDVGDTNTKESNMLIARVNQKINLDKIDDLNFYIGASFWNSDIKNNINNEKGSRNAWALFNKIDYKDFNLVLTGGKLKLNNKDTYNDYTSTLGSFDSVYNLANEGYFYTVDASYTISEKWKSLKFTPYIVMSSYKKDKEGFNDSMRNIVGLSWNVNNFTLYTEYVLSKNDPFVGGDKKSLGEGKRDEWNKLLNFNLIYSF